VNRAGEVKHSSFQLGGVDFVVLSAPIAETPTSTLTQALTRAEREVAALAIDGLTNAEIAKRRKTSVRTVASQLSVIFRKTGVGSRVELAARLGVLR